MPRQIEIPGTERLNIPEIETAATAYVKVRDRRMKLTGEEVAAKLALLQVCQAHEKELDNDADGNRVYRFDDELVLLKPGKANVKVKNAASEADEDDE